MPTSSTKRRSLTASTPDTENEPVYLQRFHKPLNQKAFHKWVVKMCGNLLNGERRNRELESPVAVTLGSPTIRSRKQRTRARGTTVANPRHRATYANALIRSPLLTRGHLFCLEVGLAPQRGLKLRLAD